MDIGVLPTRTRFFRGAHFRSVVLRVQESPPRSVVTIELEHRKPTGGGKLYVVARAVTKEPARAFAERVMTPDARRLAALLGALGPRWET